MRPLKKILVRDHHDFGIVVLAALRYALGRKTYITSVVAEFIEYYIDDLTIQDLKNIAADIERCDDYGHECDKHNWLDLLNLVTGRIKKYEDLIRNNG